MATLITLIEPLRVANHLAPAPLYDWEIAAFDGRDIPASNGLTLQAAPPAARGARLCPVELGSYLAARAGFMANRETAIHRSWAPGFQEQFAAVPVVEQLCTSADPSCAGGLAAVDLMLDLISTTHGPTLAGEVADQMLCHPDATPRHPAAARKPATACPGRWPRPWH